MSGVKSGLDNINLIITLCSALSHEDKLNVNHLVESMNNISDTVATMNVINVFMLETINRFLDFSKAQNGMKLVPKKETFDLQEAMSLPIQCMQSIQTRIHIEDINISDNICSHIITDKQWLEENMICLLSNAVKYSSEGSIKISVTPINESDLPVSAIKLTGDDVEDSSLLLVNDASSTTNTPETDLLNELTSSKNVTSTTNNRDSKIGAEVSSKTDKADNMYSTDGTDSDVESTKNFHGSSRKSSKKKEKFSLLLFEVIDTGIGISQEVMDDLFSPFKQAQRLAGGTGLGLYSLAQRIEALDGYYGVKARDDGIQGSNFWFAVPYKSDTVTSLHNSKKTRATENKLFSAVHLKLFTSNKSNSTSKVSSSLMKMELLPNSLKMSNHDLSIVNISSSPATSTVCSAANDFEKLHILLVDDSLSILKMTGTLLRKHGHTVAEAVNGADALKKLASIRANKDMKPFDLVLMDLHMPVMDGKLYILVYLSLQYT